MAQTVEEAFQVMISWLTPTATESAAARDHRESIRQCIEAKLGLVAFFRTGSFGNATSVSGYSDVDYFAVLPRERLSNHSRVSVARLMAALDERFPASGVVVDWPAVRVPFGENGAETTEVVVADYLGDMTDGLRVFDIPSPSGGWMRSSPETHHLYIRQLDKSLGGNLRPLIRLAKAWKCYCDARISSFYLELQVAVHAAGKKTVLFETDLPQVFLHIPEGSGQGFRFNVGAHSGVTWAHIPGTWAARTRPVLTRGKRRGDRGRQRAVPTGTVAEWNVTPCAESKKFSDCISTAT